jgi:hypothetical protein
MVWLTTMKEIEENPLGEIWCRPGDFKHEMPIAKMRLL